MLAQRGAARYQTTCCSVCVPSPISSSLACRAPSSDRPGPARRSLYSVIGLCGAHYTRAVPENDLGCRPAFDRRLIGRGRHLEIIDPDDVLEDLATGMVPNVDGKLKMRLVLHGTR